MSAKKIVISTGGLKDAARGFVDAWHQIEAGGTPKPIKKINFKDQRLLFKTLTSKRFELLEYVHEYGKISIRALAKELQRDYSNVHQDVKILYQLGLMIKDGKQNTYSVPWDVILTEIPLTTKSARKDISLNKHHRVKSHAAAHHATHG